jgi:hypothetical protein
LLDACLKPWGIVYNPVWQQPTSARRIANYGVSDKQKTPLGPVERYFTGRFSRDPDNHQRADCFSNG